MLSNNPRSIQDQSNDNPIMTDDRDDILRIVILCSSHQFNIFFLCWELIIESLVTYHFDSIDIVQAVVHLKIMSCVVFKSSLSGLLAITDDYSRSLLFDVILFFYIKVDVIFSVYQFLLSHHDQILSLKLSLLWSNLIFETLTISLTMSFDISLILTRGHFDYFQFSN